MKQKRVWLLSGLPGSGKSTWARQKIAENGGVWCSRDEVRFSIVKENEEYFSHEDEVFNTWIKQINKALENPEVEDVYIDATHLNDKSRNKVLNRLTKNTDIEKITNVLFLTPLETCLERNKQRSGRTVVPEEVIKNMAKTFQIPERYPVLFIKEGGEYFEW